MQGSHLYEYAVLRYLPRVEREEFINVGLVMMCKRSRWIRAAVNIDERRIGAFDNALCHAEIKRQLDGILAVAAGSPDAGPIATYPVEERFRWLTAVRSVCVQTSRPHPGKTVNLDETFDRLFAELVL